MGTPTPTIYLLHGDDEFAIARFVTDLEEKLGDPALADMNVARLDGRTYNLDDLLSIAAAMPFLTRRRIVILERPLARLTTKETRSKFIELLLKIPPTTALVIIEYQLLTSEKDRRKGDFHWLEAWGEVHRERVFMKGFPLPKGDALGRWIMTRAQAAGGQFSSDAAGMLAGMVDGDPRLADQEIQKLLTYVNFSRPVESGDVELLTADVAQGDIFAMVDALGNYDGKTALGILHRLLEQEDPGGVFGMILRQFRLLLLARDVLDRGGQVGDVQRELRLIPFVAGKVAAQARQLKNDDLELAYQRLVELDEAIKTSLVPGDLALDTFVASFVR
jgi:DNA polymerase III subunit delta